MFQHAKSDHGDHSNRVTGRGLVGLVMLVVFVLVVVFLGVRKQMNTEGSCVQSTVSWLHGDRDEVRYSRVLPDEVLIDDDQDDDDDFNTDLPPLKL